MSNKRHETIADLVAWLRRPREGENAYLTLWREEIADRIEAAEKHSVTKCNRFGNAAKMREALEKADEKRISDAVIQSLRDKKLEMAGEIAEKDEEIAELRECMKEAIREKCPFTRMSCKHGEPCNYECGTDKWRKALGEEGGAK